MDKLKSKILIIEDDLDLAEMLNAFFRVQGYEVYTSNWGEDGIRVVNTFRPNLVILDIRLPDIDGYEVARRLRSDRKSKTIPIIFLTEKRDRSDRLQGLELGADDYITKPFDVQELRLRVRNAIRRVEMDSLTNPVTGLPEREVVMDHLGACLKKDQWAVMLVSLNNLDVFHEQYGFVASDDVIRAVSLMVSNTLHEVGEGDEFLGHISANEFLVFTDPVIVGTLNERIRSRLGKALDYFYPMKDRDVNTQHKDSLGIQTACITSSEGHFTTLDELTAELIKRKK